MTCIEKWLLEHPDEKDNVFQTIEKYCPSEFGIMPDPDYCDPDSGITCAKCWMRDIPEINETETENKKEKEEMSYATDALINSLQEELEAVKATLNVTKQEFEECKNLVKRQDKQILDQILAIENLKADKRIRDEEIDKLVNELDIIETTRDRMAETITELEGKLQEKDQQLVSYRKTNKDLGNKLTETRVRCDRVLLENHELKEQIVDFDICLKEKIEALASKDKRISELCERINKLDEARYVEADIAATKELYDLFRQAQLTVIPKEESTIRPITELPYHRYAHHIHMKYKSLVDSGFSHDDAMGLIPMWDDTEFKGFKNDGFRSEVHYIDEMHEYREANK